LDEVARAKRGRIVKQLLDLQTMYTKLIIVISSRHDHYLDAWSLSRLFYVQPMAKKTVLSLISKLPYDKQLTRQFRDEVDMNLYEEHRSFLSNPLLVSVMLITYGQSGNVPDQMHLFYEQAFEALFYRHDTFKDATFRRVHYTALPINVFRNCLSAFCIITYSKSLFEFSSRAKVLDLIERAAKHENTEVDAGSFLDDCIETICVLQYEGLAIKFTHRSFQEYFAAVYIARDPPIELPRYLDRLLGRVGDNVLMMAWDMNSPLLERSWILPHLIRLSNELHGLDGLAVARKLLGTFTYSAVPSGRFSVSGGTSTERHWEFLCLIEELYTDALPSVRDSIEFNDEDRTAVKAIWDQYRDAYPWGSDKAAIEGMGTSWPSAYAAFRQIAEHMKKFGPTHKTGTLSHAEEIRQRSDAKFEEWARLSHSVGDADVSWFKSTRAFAQFGHLPVEVRRLAISLQSKLDESKHIEEDLFG
jgi:hypothetical protein